MPISNDKQLKFRISLIGEKVIARASADITKKIQDTIQTYVYDWAESDELNKRQWYWDKTGKPTEEFKEAFHFDDIQKGAKSMVTKLFYDWQNKMYSDPSTWKHYGVLESGGFNRDTRKEMAEAFNIDGFVDGNFRDRARMPYWDIFIEECFSGELDELFKKYMIEEFTHAGFKIIKTK